MANWTFIRPTTPSFLAMRRVCSRIVCRWRPGQMNGGTTHELSPEWMPASSMCSMMPPITTAPVRSAMASTSNSNASSRNLSTSTGCSGDASTACVMYRSSVATGRPLGLDHGHDVLERQRLEVQPVRRVVVGRHGFRIAVHHDRLETFFAKREAGMAATVVELDALSDPVRPAAEDDDLALR